MKKYILTILACLTTLFANAQLVVNESGRIKIGEWESPLTPPNNPYDPIFPYSLPGGNNFYIGSDTIAMLNIYGTREHDAGAYMNFGNSTANHGYVSIGELGVIDTDKVWLHGRKGLYFTTLDNDTVCYYDADKGNYFQFNCDVKTTGVFVSSDSRGKSNITPLGDASYGLSQISPVSYYLTTAPTMQRVASASEQTSESDEKQLENQTIKSKFNTEKNSSLRFGFIAQEVKEIYPELVKTDSDGYMSVDYIGFIPLLVDAVNGLQAKVDEQEAIIEQLTTELNATPNQAPSRKQSSIDNIGISTVLKLYQNSPNPFSERTQINVELPGNISQADIYIFDMQGKQIQKITISERGKTAVNVEASSLQPGMYIYSLIADGVEVDSKRMILTD